jgi:hypothetical protein
MELKRTAPIKISVKTFSNPELFCDTCNGDLRMVNFAQWILLMQNISKCNEPPQFDVVESSEE